MKITFFGTGYVGLVAAACFADKGNHLVCVDINAERVAALRAGKIPIFEPGLEDLLKKNNHRMVFTTDANEGIAHAEVIFLAVGTPQKKGSSEADLQYIDAAARSIATHMTSSKIIVIKSTVPVGTAAHVTALMRGITKHPVTVVSNPEFLKEGDAIRDFEFPDRVVVGTNDERARIIMRDLYEPFFRRNDRFIFMSNESAELTKYGANIMLAARIALINEFARIAEKTGADISHVRQAIGADERIGISFLYPSPGYGGSCFPKDIREAGALATRVHAPCTVIDAIDRSNEQQKQHFTERVIAELDHLKGKKVAVWGIAFKHKTDDIRESASLVLMDALLKHGAQVAAHDPEGMEHAKKIYGTRVEFGEQYDILDDADILVIVTDWNDFKSPDFETMRERMKQHVIMDGRNLYNLDRVKMEGFTYHSVGRPTIAK